MDSCSCSRGEVWIGKEICGMSSDMRIHGLARRLMCCDCMHELCFFYSQVSRWIGTYAEKTAQEENQENKGTLFM